MKKILMLMASVALLATACSKNDDNSGNGDGNGNGGTNKLATPSISLVGNATTSSFTVQWNAVPNAEGYEAELEGITGSNTYVSTTTCTFTGLDEDTAYVVKVKAVATGYTDSDWGTFSVYTDKKATGGDEGDDLPAALTGSNYYIIQIDNASADEISDKIKMDIRGCHIYAWGTDQGYQGGESSGGSNWRGSSDEGWFYMMMTPISWWGIGWCLTDEQQAEGMANVLADIDADYENYYLHLAIKSQKYGTYQARLYSGSGENELSGVINIGTNYKYDFDRDGDWHEIEIPISEFYAKGLDYSGAVSTTTNVFAVGDDGDASAFAQELQIDAVFIYKK